jgi:hypothetical protein
VTWFAYGAILGPVASGLVLMAPPGSCPNCGQRVRGWSWTCVTCGQDLRIDPELAPMGTVVVAPDLAAAAVPMGEGVTVTPPPAPQLALPPPPLKVTAPSRLLVSTASVAPGRTAKPSKSKSSRSTTAAAGTRSRGRQGAPAKAAATTKSSNGIPTNGRAPVPAARPATNGAGHARRAAAPPPPNEVRILASAVFVGGNAPLLPGARYGIGVHEQVLHVLGPLDTSPDKVVVSRRLDELDVTALGDRIVLSASSPTLGSIGVVFTGINGRTAGGLEEALAPSAATPEGVALPH